MKSSNLEESKMAGVRMTGTRSKTGKKIIIGDKE